MFSFNEIEEDDSKCLCSCCFRESLSAPKSSLHRLFTVESLPEFFVFFLRYAEKTGAFQRVSSLNLKADFPDRKSESLSIFE